MSIGFTSNLAVENYLNRGVQRELLQQRLSRVRTVARTLIGCPFSVPDCRDALSAIQASCTKRQAMRLLSTSPFHAVQKCCTVNSIVLISLPAQDFVFRVS